MTNGKASGRHRAGWRAVGFDAGPKVVLFPHEIERTPGRGV